MTSNDKLISVVVPTYNYAHYLPRVLDSVLGQWADDLELVIVDDGSTDDTGAVLARYAERSPSIRVIRQPNGGAASARNLGVSNARGQYVLPLDADDELVPSALQVFRSMLTAHPGADLMLAGHLSVMPDGRERLRTPAPVKGASPADIARAYLLHKCISISHSCTLVRRELLAQRPYPQRLRTGEDVPVFAFILVNGQTVVTDQVVARIHKHADSLRNDRSNEEAYALEMADEVFSSLPQSCQFLRPRYVAQRYLSLFRAAYQARDYAAARGFYRKALKLSLRQALRWPYLSKALRLLFKA
ncbi:glycosyltransferase family 2 protein [Pseudomonas sp. TE3610]